jgi:hypothetical protein
MSNLDTQLRDLIKNSQTLQKNEELRHDVETNLPNLTAEQKSRLTQTLLTEQEKLTQIQKEHDEAMAELNEETLAKGKALLNKANRVVREEKENKQEAADDAAAAELLSDL